MFNLIKSLFMGKRDIILHSHIFKNAGTTFDYSLEKNFGKNFIDHRDDIELYKLANQLLNNKISKIKNFEEKLYNFRKRLMNND